MASGFAEEWAATPDALKAVLVRELLLVIHVRVVSRAGIKNAIREVVGWEYQPWLEEVVVRYFPSS